MKTIPSFDVTLEDDTVIWAIANRACSAGKPHFNKLGLIMDLKACHANGCPLNLDQLLAANPFDFFHDLLGIDRHLDRATGQLQNHFLPRHAR